MFRARLFLLFVAYRNSPWKRILHSECKKPDESNGLRQTRGRGRTTDRLIKWKTSNRNRLNGCAFAAAERVIRIRFIFVRFKARALSHCRQLKSEAINFSITGVAARPTGSLDEHYKLASSATVIATTTITILLVYVCVCVFVYIYKQYILLRCAIRINVSWACILNRRRAIRTFLRGQVRKGRTFLLCSNRNSHYTGYRSVRYISLEISAIFGMEAISSNAFRNSAKTGTGTISIGTGKTYSIEQTKHRKYLLLLTRTPKALSNIGGGGVLGSWFIPRCFAANENVQN